MKVSTKTYYAMRALSVLANTPEPLSARVISEQEDLPYEYLEKIFQQLRKAGFVESVRGASGGYRLATSPTEITLGEILTELEGPFFTLPCFSPEGCHRSKECHTKNVWDTINRTLDAQLQTITLKDILSS